MSIDKNLVSSKRSQRVILGKRKSTEELIQAVAAASRPYGLNRNIKELLESDLREVSNVVNFCGVLLVSNKDLGITQGASLRSVHERMSRRNLRLLTLEEAMEWFLVDQLLESGEGVHVATKPFRTNGGRGRRFHVIAGRLANSTKYTLGIRFIESHLLYRTTTLWVCAWR